jgi:hypothetical protein
LLLIKVYVQIFVIKCAIQLERLLRLHLVWELIVYGQIHVMVANHVGYVLTYQIQMYEPNGVKDIANAKFVMPMPMRLHRVISGLQVIPDDVFVMMDMLETE